MDEEIKFNKLIPELSVTDIKKSKQFYLSLGFKIMYEREEDNFVFLELDGNQIMIEQINDHWNTGKLEYPFGRGINISMSVIDIESYYQSLVKKDIKIFKPLMTNKYEVNGKIYDDKEFLIQDLDGYLLRFND